MVTDAEDFAAILAILDRDDARLRAIKFDKFVVLESVKNNLEALEFLLSTIRIGPNVDSAIFMGIKDNQTFALFERAEISSANLTRECVSADQWAYVLRIGYVTEQGVDEDMRLEEDGLSRVVYYCPECRIVLDDDVNVCANCGREIEPNEKPKPLNPLALVPMPECLCCHVPLDKCIAERALSIRFGDRPDAII